MKNIILKPYITILTLVADYLNYHITLLSY